MVGVAVEVAVWVAVTVLPVRAGEEAMGERGRLQALERSKRDRRRTDLRIVYRG